MPNTSPTDRVRRISSRQNAFIKELRRAFSAHELTKSGFCAIESRKTVEEAIRSDLKFRAVLFSDSGLNRASRLLPQIKRNVEVLVVADDIFRSVVDTEAPQGVAALVELPGYDLKALLAADSTLTVFVAGLQDPGNLGTILRSSEAFLANGVIVGEGTVSRFNSKVIRASAGSLFRLPCVASKFAEVLRVGRERGVRFIGTSSHKGTPLDQSRLTRSVVIVIGNEGAGLPAEIMKELDEIVAIPHSPTVESLNAGVATSVILYEAMTQRNK